MADESLHVSVIIPVYNAAPFVARAVESALEQPETAEVILVEDGSPDDSLAVCEELAAADPRVRLFRHPDGGNHGAGASRNLGILHSTAPFIAFLDADDYMLPGRFTHVAAIFQAQPDVDGVYDAVGTQFENEAARTQWIAARPGWPDYDLTTMTARVAPQDLFAALVSNQYGGFCTDGITVRRALLDRTGLFNASLRLHQDTELWWRMAAVGRLVPGRLEEPVAMRRVHASNRISAPRPAAERHRLRMGMWWSVWRWARVHLSRAQQELVFTALLKEMMRPYRTLPDLQRRVCCAWRLNTAALSEPRVLLAPYFYKLYVARMLRYAGLWNLFARLTGREPDPPREDTTA